MDNDEYKELSSAIWEKAEAHIKKMYEFTYHDEQEGTRKPLEFAGFGEAVLGLLNSLIEMHEQLVQLERDAGRDPQIQTKTFRHFLQVLKTRIGKT